MDNMNQDEYDNCYKHLQQREESTISLEITCSEPFESDKRDAITRHQSSEAIVPKSTILSRIKAITCTSIHQFVIDNFIPIGFAIILIFSLIYPYPGKFISEKKIVSDFLHSGVLDFINVCIVFFISGLTLKVEDMKDVLKQPWIILYGLLTINFLTSLLAYVMIALPFKPHEFSIGAAIFVTVPTTLGVGVALTQVITN